MWTAWARGGLYLAVLAFLMQVVVWILSPILDMANSGPHASTSSVQRIGSYFDALATVDNLTIIAALGVAVYLLGRAATERKLSP